MNYRRLQSGLKDIPRQIRPAPPQNKTLEAMAETLFRKWFVEEEWEKGKLGDVIELIYGNRLKEEIRSGAGFPVVGSNGIVGYHSEFLVEGPGIVISRSVYCSGCRECREGKF